MNGDPAQAQIKSSLLIRFFELLDTEGIRYVVLSGYENYPSIIESDVDFMVSSEDFSRLGQVLLRGSLGNGVNLIQMIQHEVEASYFVYCAPATVPPVFLHPDASGKYVRHGRYFLDPGPVLGRRRRSPQGFWIPCASDEFIYYLIKRADKGLLEPKHAERLRKLFAEDAAGAKAVAIRYFGLRLATEMTSALESQDFHWLCRNVEALRGALTPRPLRFTALLKLGLFEMLRVVRRVMQPTGLVVAVLGPDGVGKSSILKFIEDEYGQAFRRVARFHLRPKTLRKGSAANEVNRQPHALPPRGLLAGLIKVGLFVADYLVSWPKILCWRSASTLVLFDRYFDDLLVDPARYRFKARPPAWIQMLVPRPDIMIVLTASGKALAERKGELSPAKGESLAGEYSALAMKLAQRKQPVRLLNTDGDLERTLQSVSHLISSHLHERTSKRLRAGAASK